MSNETEHPLWTKLQQEIEAASAHNAKRDAERAAKADSKAANKALYEYRIAMWARHKAELAALKAKHAAALAALQERHANEASLVKQ